ncbi:DUF2304 domain-containing protein [Candidatus Woesearchaeota archaeon]|nr:DUF2304 domain-containing protein [Candidatus Woesearchaeota archaeon]
MYGIQIIGIFLSLLMAYVSYIYIKQGKVDKGKGWMWIFIWFGAIIWLSFADYTKQILLGITNVATIFELTIGMGVLFAVLVGFFNYLKVAKIEKNIETLVRNLALKEAMEEEENGKTSTICKSKSGHDS